MEGYPPLWGNLITSPSLLNVVLIVFAHANSLQVLENLIWPKQWRLRPTIRPFSLCPHRISCQNGSASRRNWFETCLNWPVLTNRPLFSSTKLIRSVRRGQKTNPSLPDVSRRNFSFRCRAWVRTSKESSCWQPPTFLGCWIQQFDDDLRRGFTFLCRKNRRD